MKCIAFINNSPSPPRGVGAWRGGGEKNGAILIGLMPYPMLCRPFRAIPQRSYPPKLSYIIDSGSTPNESSIPTTAFDIGPGPHM